MTPRDDEHGVPDTAAPLPGAPGELVPNVARFVGLLRSMGLPVDVTRGQLALESLALLGVGSRRTVAAALRATLVTHRAYYELFDLAFAAFFEGASPMAASVRGAAADEFTLPPGARRLAEALGVEAPRVERAETRERAAGTAATADPGQKKKDFGAMSRAELVDAHRAIHTLRPSWPMRRGRRLASAPRGSRVDLPRTFRESVRTGGELGLLRRAAPPPVPRPVVFVFDVSGSMEPYARTMMHFAWALARGPGRTTTFAFGSSLSPLGRALDSDDPDVAVERAMHAIRDVGGGTRIAASLDELLRVHARRALAGGAVLLLVTDGIERGDPDDLARVASRLRRATTQLVWLNPLLRWEGFEARTRGAKALLAEVDEMRPVHSLESVEALAAALDGFGRRRRHGGTRRWTTTSSS